LSCDAVPQKGVSVIEARHRLRFRETRLFRRQKLSNSERIINISQIVCALAEQPALTRRNKKSRNAKHDEDIDLINLHCMAEGSVPGRPGKVRGGLFGGCSVLRSRASIPRAAGAVPHLCPRSASRMRRFPVRAASSTDTGCDRTLPVVPRPSRPDASFSCPIGRSFDGSF